VIALAKVAAQRGGIYSAHIRDEGAASIASVEEMIRIGREAGLPVQITHHKLMGQAQWGQSVQTLALVDSARAHGQDVTLDQYPYDATSTAISTIFPPWSLAGGADSLRARLADPATRSKIVAGIESTIVRERGGGDLSRIQLASYGAHHAWDGETFADVLKERGQAQDLAEAAALAIEIQTHGGAQGVWHVVDEADIRRIMTYPWTMFSSDGEIGVLDHAHPHPRNYGATARILGRYVRDEKVLSLEEAVRKLTSLPAWRFGQKERGTLAEGQWGDVVVFDPARVRDLATYADPHRFSVGVEYVWVNGAPVLMSSSLTGAKPGRVLRRQFPAGAETYRYEH
jgi:N-acyl-D-aspartate/D-glutamate deacylase